MKVLECKQCSKRWHQWCLNPPKSATLIKKAARVSDPQNAWYCPECKHCQICKGTNNKESMLSCSMCDYTAHLHCLKLPKMPIGKWTCLDCISCLSCQTILPQLASYNDGQWMARQWGPRESPVACCRLCDECKALHLEGSICTICNRATYEDSANDQDDNNFVCCDHCESWVHAACDGIDEAEFARIENESYMCPICRRNRDRSKGNSITIK